MQELSKAGQLQSATADRVDNLASSPGLQVSLADLNGDGRDELLVQFPAGAHGSGLQVFGFRGLEFGLLAELGVGTPVGFRVQDYDNDGRLEVVTKETDWTVDLQYAYAPRERLYYRLRPEGFQEVARIKDYSADDLREAKRKAAEPT